MSKIITRSIAALGVIAGLSIAALPLTSYAASDTANVQVTAVVGAAPFSVASTGNIALSSATAGSIMGTGSTTVNVVSNAPGGYVLRMGTPNGGTRGINLVNVDNGTFNIPGVATLTAAETGWQYGYLQDNGTVTSFVQPVQFSSGYAGGTVIGDSASNAIVGNSSWTIGARYGLAASNTLASGNYTNNIVIFGAENI